MKRKEVPWLPKSSSGGGVPGLSSLWYGGKSAQLRQVIGEGLRKVKGKLWGGADPVTGLVTVTDTLGHSSAVVSLRLCSMPTPPPPDPDPTPSP